ncbi:MarR family winged helix-turn-helix transcriptional regulator [Alkalicoccus daliensis]|uniref:DNA-binding transcriptional regulator, MarR family n=1 Tax=Alkalicoccus daliensis TaxID=745820 RepID=A0A1H0INV4_9BACI|nr:MarR family transcriptional regulator [Alkalicoccus daliensis]SDO33184.1 DNA-binding transcriptional regulator, MarR family [Alkalicoccus daliensis]
MNNKRMEEAVGYQLSLTAHLIHNQHNRSLANRGLSRSLVRILYLLREDGPQSQTELQNKLRVQGSTMNGLIESLLKKNLIIKAESENDRRRKVIEITEAGREVESAVWKEMREMEEELTAGISEDQQQWLLETLKSMQQKLEQRKEQ